MNVLLESANKLYIYQAKNLVSGHPKDPYTLGPPFLKPFGLLKPIFRTFKDFFFTFFHAKVLFKKMFADLLRVIQKR